MGNEGQRPPMAGRAIRSHGSPAQWWDASAGKRVPVPSPPGGSRSRHPSSDSPPLYPRGSEPVCRVPNRPRMGSTVRGGVWALIAVTLLARPVAAQAPRLFYEQDGEGAAVVLIPDWAHDTGSWFRLLPRFRTGGWRLVRYDLRGQGRSDPPADGDYSLEAHIEDLRRLLDGLEIDRAHLVGTGLGAAIALEFSWRYPDRVASVAAIDPRLGWSDAEREEWARLLDAWERVGKPTLGEYTSVLVGRWLGTDFADRNPWIVPWYDLMLRRQSAASLTDSMRAWLSAAVESPEEPSPTPTLIAVGERWRGADVLRDPRLARALGRAWRERIDDSAGQPALDAPGDLADRLTEFLERAADSGS
jgi:pimeloyl-ACP methyl ester carboxylesterase